MKNYKQINQSVILSLMESFKEKINNNSDIIKCAANDINKILVGIHSNLGESNEEFTPEINQLLLSQVLVSYRKEFQVTPKECRFQLVKFGDNKYRVKDYDLFFKEMWTRKGEYLCIGGYGKNTRSTGQPEPLTEGQKEICRKYNVEMI